MKILLHWIIGALAVLVAAYLVPGITVSSFVTALIVAALLAVLNILLKPILVILTLPINILTLGLFTFVINGLLLWLVGSFVKGFEVSGFIAAFLGALVISIVKALADLIIK